MTKYEQEQNIKHMRALNRVAFVGIGLLVIGLIGVLL